MRVPWIARSSYQAMVDLLSAEIAELKTERRMLLDRLAVLGLGGPLYAAASNHTEAAADAERDDQPQTEALEQEQATVEELLRLRRRPGKLADALARNLRRAQGKRPPGPRVAWVSEGDPVNVALDRAEELGRWSVSLTG